MDTSLVNSHRIDVTDHEIDEFCRHAKVSVSIGFRQFLQSLNGCILKSNIFKIGEHNNAGVNAYIPLSQYYSERERLCNLGEQTFPIAWAEGGNYVVVDFGSNERIYFWDHELPGCLVKVASNIDEFNSMLESFSTSEVNLQPGQVKSVWIDPVFLDSLMK